MVSKNPNPADGSYLDPTGMAALPGLSPFATTTTPLTTTTTSSSTSEDPSKKIRKPYTITKSRESWTEPEHDKFLEALQLFDRDWKKIGAFIGSKTIIQIRSHAQKKATHPYPQKASKNSIVPSQPSDAFQSSSAPLEPGYVLRPDSSSIPVDPIPSAAVASSWTNNVQTVSLSNQTKGPVAANNCCNGTESSPRTKLIGKTAEQGNHGHSMRVLPDFSQVYGFIGSVFDPNVTDQLQNLKKMDPIDVETVLLLMRNLSLNLNSPSFEEHRMLLSSHETDSETIGANNNVDQSMNVA
ncbi:hypothetical protein OIU78_000535 [Salix suchowensis]|nr:hypothetical protein OIU78_000535 [Salix suchowensis]